MRMNVGVSSFVAVLAVGDTLCDFPREAFASLVSWPMGATALTRPSDRVTLHQCTLPLGPLAFIGASSFFIIPIFYTKGAKKDVKKKKLPLIPLS